MSHHRVLVTGLGAVSALAADKDEHLRRLLAGESGVARFSRPVHPEFSDLLEARVVASDLRKSIRNRMLRKLLTPSAAYAVSAAGQALADAGADGNEALLRRCGLYVGSVCVDVDPEIFIPALKESIDSEGKLDIKRFAGRGLFLIDPLFLVKSLPNAGLGGIAIEYHVTGPNLNITNGPVSGLQAVAAAFSALRRGDADIALAGGYDSLLGIDSIAEHLIAGRLAVNNHRSEEGCRPFDLGRTGYALGEGAVFIVLETEEHATKRSPRVYGELLAAAQATDTSLETPDRGDGEGLYRAARQVLRRTGASPLEPEVVFGDGLAVESHDQLEASAVHRLFGEETPAYTAATPAIGFTGSAGGVFSLSHAAEGLYRGVVPPMLNCARPDPSCPLDFVHHVRQQPFRQALVWSSDRGVKNVAVVIGAFGSG